MISRIARNNNNDYDDCDNTISGNDDSKMIIIVK